VKGKAAGEVKDAGKVPERNGMVYPKKERGGGKTPLEKIFVNGRNCIFTKRPRSTSERGKGPPVKQQNDLLIKKVISESNKASWEGGGEGKTGVPE